MSVRYVFELSEAERDELQSVIADSRTGSQKRQRAQILLAVDRGVPDVTIER